MKKRIYGKTTRIKWFEYDDRRNSMSFAIWHGHVYEYLDVESELFEVFRLANENREDIYSLYERFIIKAGYKVVEKKVEVRDQRKSYKKAEEPTLKKKTYNNNNKGNKQRYGK